MLDLKSVQMQRRGVVSGLTSTESRRLVRAGDGKEAELAPEHPSEKS